MTTVRIEPVKVASFGIATWAGTTPRPEACLRDGELVGVADLNERTRATAVEQFGCRWLFRLEAFCPMSRAV